VLHNQRESSSREVEGIFTRSDLTRAGGLTFCSPTHSHKLRQLPYSSDYAWAPATLFFATPERNGSVQSSCTPRFARLGGMLITSRRKTYSQCRKGSFSSWLMFAFWILSCLGCPHVQSVSGSARGSRSTVGSAAGESSPGGFPVHSVVSHPSLFAETGDGGLLASISKSAAF
jgi:hypothetical protein